MTIKQKDFVETINIKKLNKQQKEKLLNSMYTKYKFEITLLKGGFKSNPDVILSESYKNIPDLCVSNFYHNYYFRTKKGINAEKYNKIGILLNSLKRIIKSNNWELISNLRVYYNRQHIFSIEL